MLSKDTNEKIFKYIQYLMDHSSAENPMWNIEKVLEGKPNKWNYIDGCMVTAILSLYEMTKEQKYLDFADRFVGWFVQEDGSIKTYDPQEKNLDNINMGRSLFPLYDLTGKEKYRLAMDTIRSQIDLQNRCECGNFWHKDIYPYQVWLDGLYMAQPFYMEYETRYNKMQGCKDSYTQFCNVEKYMKDETTGLYYHCWDERHQMYWCDPETGRSKHYWLRALGWFACSLVATAEVMDESQYYEYRHLQRMLENLAESLVPYQDEKTGMFYDILDAPEDERNYLETSGTALIAYALLRGVRLGYIPERFAVVGEKAFEGIVDRYLEVAEDGTLSLGGICLVSGLGGKTHRDGSLEYYFSEPVVKNEAKGTAPFILAYTEVLRRSK